MIHKLPNAQEQQQIELQKQSFIANTRLRLAETYLNTIIGRPDFDVTLDEAKEIAAEMAVDFSTALMVKLGMVVLTPVE